MSTSPPIFSGSSPVNDWLPSDNGLLLAAYDPVEATGTAITTAGTMYLVKLTPRTSVTITNLWISIQTAGSGTSTGSFVGLYNSAGTLLSGSADIGTSLASAGALSTALTTPQAVTAGSFYWAAILTNLGTTQPTLREAVGPVGGSSNVNLSAAVSRFASNGTLQTVLPSTITPASNSQAAGNSYWVGAN